MIIWIIIYHTLIINQEIRKISDFQANLLEIKLFLILINIYCNKTVNIMTVYEVLLYI